MRSLRFVLHPRKSGKAYLAGRQDMLDQVVAVLESETTLCETDYFKALFGAEPARIMADVNRDLATHFRKIRA